MEKALATHSSVLAWRIPGMWEPGGLLSMGSHRAGHDWSDLAAAAARILRSLPLGWPMLQQGVKRWTEPIRFPLSGLQLEIWNQFACWKHRKEHICREELTHDNVEHYKEELIMPTVQIPAACHPRAQSPWHLVVSWLLFWGFPCSS